MREPSANVKQLLNLKERAMRSQENPLQLIENVFDSTSQAAKLITPSHGTMSTLISRAKKKASRAPVMPLTRRAIHIPNDYATYESSPGQKESFVIGDSGEFN